MTSISDLIRFLDLLLSISESTPQELQHAEKIRDILEDFENNQGKWEWNIALNIYDMDLMDGKGQGVFCRKWMASFERGTLEIEAGTYHTKDDSGYYVSGFRLWKHIDFNKNMVHQHPAGHTIADFVEDARNYLSYITASLNDIEVDIELWKRKG